MSWLRKNDLLEKKRLKWTFFIWRIPVFSVSVSLDEDGLYQRFISRFLKEKEDYLYGRIIDRYERERAVSRAYLKSIGKGESKK